MGGKVQVENKGKQQKDALKENSGAPQQNNEFQSGTHTHPHCIYPGAKVN